MFDSVERARIVATVPRARNAPGTTDKALKPLLNQDVKMKPTHVVFCQTYDDGAPSVFFVFSLAAAGAAVRSMRDAGFDAWHERYNPALNY